MQNHNNNSNWIKNNKLKYKNKSNLLNSLLKNKSNKKKITNQAMMKNWRLESDKIVINWNMQCFN